MKRKELQFNCFMNRIYGRNLQQLLIFSLSALLILSSSIAGTTLIGSNSPQAQPLPSRSLQMTSSAPYISWNVTWGGVDYDVGYDIAFDTGGNLYCVGYAGSYLALIKFFPNGTRAWNVTWGGDLADVGKSVAIDAGGNLYCVGSTWSFGAGSSAFAVVKVAPNGTQLWNVTWGGTKNDWCCGVTLDTAGNLYCAGYTASFGEGGYDWALVKFFPNSTRAWNVTWGGAQIDSCWGVAIDAGGNLYCVGSTESFGAGSSDLALVKFFPNSTRAWNVTWGGVRTENCYDIAIDTGGNLYCVGSTRSFGVGSSGDWALVKFFPNNTRAWNVTWGGVRGENCYDIAIDTGGNLYCVGSTESFGAGSVDWALVQFFPNGTRAWNITWGGINYDMGEGVVIDAGGNLYCVGSTSSFGEGGYDWALVKFGFLLDNFDPILPNPDADGRIELTWSEVTGATSYYIYRELSNIISIEGLTPKYIVSGHNFTDTLTMNGVYYYVIVAGNSTRNSSRSNCRSVTVAMPFSAPVLALIVPNPDADGVILVNWTEITGATHYYIYRELSTITSLAGLTPKYTVAGHNCTDTLTTNGIYYYAIVAGNAFANSSRSNCENITVRLFPNFPKPPTLSPISPNPDSDGLIQLSWTNVTGATTYYVYRSSANITSVSGFAPLAAVSRCAYQDRLYRNGTYYYAIVASNLTRNSSLSNCESVRGELFIINWILLRDFRFLNAIRQDEFLILEFNLTRSVSFPVNITIVIVGEQFAVYNYSFSLQNNSLFIHVELPYQRAHFLDQGQRALQVSLLYNGTQVVSVEISVTVLLSFSSLFIVSSVIAIGAVTAATVTYQVAKRRSAQKKVLQFLTGSKSQKIAIPVLSAMTQVAPQKASQIVTQLMGRNEIRGTLKGDTFYRKQKTSSTASFQNSDEGAWDVEEAITEKLQPVNLVLESLVILFQSRAINRETFELVKAELLAERRKLKQALLLGNKNL